MRRALTGLVMVATIALAGCGGGGADVGAEDVASRDAAADDAGGRDATPLDVGPRDAEPQDATGADAEPQDALLEDAEPVDAGLADAEPSDAFAEDASPTDAEPHDALPTDAEPQDALPDDASPPDAGLEDAEPLDAAVVDVGVSDAGMQDTGAADTGPGDAGGPDSGLHPCAPVPGEVPSGYILVSGTHDLTLNSPDTTTSPLGCSSVSMHWAEPSFALLTPTGPGTGELYYPLTGAVDTWTLGPVSPSGSLLSIQLSGPCHPAGSASIGFGSLDIDLVTGGATIAISCTDNAVAACPATAVEHQAFGSGNLACDRPDGGAPDTGVPDGGMPDAGDYCYYPTMVPPQGVYTITSTTEVCITTSPGCSQSCITSHPADPSLVIESVLLGGSVIGPAPSWENWRIRGIQQSGDRLIFAVRIPDCDSTGYMTSYGHVQVDVVTGAVDGVVVCTQDTPFGCPTDPITYEFTFSGDYVANTEATGCWQGQINTCTSGQCTTFGPCGAPCLP